MISARTPARRICRLSLRAPTAELAQHSAIILSDALHTASIPEADQGRLVVIRRLDLGRIDPNAVSSTLALRVEHVLRSVITNAQRADSPLATNASAIVFRDFTHALVLLTRRVAAHQSTHEWFWHAAFPEWRKVTSQSSAWQILLDIAHNQEVPAQAVASVVREAVAAGAIPEMVENISVANVSGWLRRIDLDPSIEMTRSGFTEYEFRSIDKVISEKLKTCIVKIGVRDLRSFWLAAIGMLIARPSLVIVNDLAVRVRAWLDYNEVSENTGIAGSTSATESDYYHGVSLDIKKGTLEQRNDHTVRNCKEVSENTDAEATKSSTAELLQTQQEAVETAANAFNQTFEVKENKAASGKIDFMRIEAVDLAWEWSESGGLLFLVSIMERLGIREFLEKNPQLAEDFFPQRFLIHAGQRTGLLSSDPLITLLMNEPAETTDDLDFQMSPKLSDFLSGSYKQYIYKTPYDAWLKAVRRWCRLEAKMGLFNLIRRKSLVLASQTHIDIFFDPGQADIRLRRLALDVDPGWVPWLGFIIRFHYGEINDY